MEQTITISLAYYSIIIYKMAFTYTIYNYVFFDTSRPVLSETKRNNS